MMTFLSQLLDDVGISVLKSNALVVNLMDSVFDGEVYGEGGSSFYIQLIPHHIQHPVISALIYPDNKERCIIRLLVLRVGGVNEDGHTKVIRKHIIIKPFSLPPSRTEGLVFLRHRVHHVLCGELIASL